MPSRMRLGMTRLRSPGVAARVGVTKLSSTRLTVEVKFYNMEVELDKDLQTCHPGLYVIGDGSGVTHSLSHASASGVYVARRLSDTL